MFSFEAQMLITIKRGAPTTKSPTSGVSSEEKARATVSTVIALIVKSWRYSPPICTVSYQGALMTFLWARACRGDVKRYEISLEITHFYAGCGFRTVIL